MSRNEILHKKLKKRLCRILVVWLRQLNPAQMTVLYLDNIQYVIYRALLHLDSRFDHCFFGRKFRNARISEKTHYGGANF